MARLIGVEPRNTLEDYAGIVHLIEAVNQYRQLADRVAPRLAGRTLWMVNSTEKGGGVAEMLPAMVTLLRDVGIATEWVVIESDDPDFFALTKRIHNLIHGAGDPQLGPADRELFEAVNRANAEQLRAFVHPGDIVAVHDPQPMPLAVQLRESMELRTIWRCHIGLDEENAATRAAWSFLEPFAAAYDRAIFSAPEYVPEYLLDRAVIIHPAIDPLSEKNQDLALHKLIGVLVNSALLVSPGRVLTPPYRHLAQRMLPDGSFAPASLQEDIGVLTRPIVTQVSRWDRLKGFMPLLEAFVELKRRIHDGRDAARLDPVNRRRLDLVRLLLVGPDPGSVADDPEGREVIAELRDAFTSIDPAIQDDIALITLPMAVPCENALMVNALQRASTILVQNSLREGFGLTVTEAMWKRVPILSNSQAVGPRYQVRDGLDGRLIHDPQDTGELATALNVMLADSRARAVWGQMAQRRVHDRFLVFSQLQGWLQLLADLV